MASVCFTHFVELMVTVLLLTLNSTNTHRGPHHPKGPSITHEEHQHHHHYIPHRRSPDHHEQPPKILTHDTNLLHDKEHMIEDMGDWIFEDGRNPTPEEMEFHYFKMHDFDSNSKLDGLEIFQALSHVLPAVANAENFPDVKGNGKGDARVAPSPLTKMTEEDFNYYIDLIDKVLEEDDVDNDGYLSYAEYVHGRRQGEDENARLKTGTRPRRFTK